MEQKICQSCGIPMVTAEEFGTNSDGSVNNDYCVYCFKDGKFTVEATMDVEQLKKIKPNIYVRVPFKKEGIMKKLEKISICFRWLAHIIGGITVLMFIVFTFGEGFPALSALSTVEMIMFIFLVIALLGILVSWRWSLIGCLLIVVGYAGFAISDKQLSIVSPFTLFLVIVALYVLAWVFNKPSGPCNAPSN